MFKDGFKDTAVIIPVSFSNGRTEANIPKYNPEDAVKNVPCRIRKVSENDIKIYFEKTQPLNKGDCVFFIKDKEAYTVDFVKEVYSKKEMHHKTADVSHTPAMIKLLESMKDE